jgi:hypothetical protein
MEMMNCRYDYSKLHWNDLKTTCVLAVLRLAWCRAVGGSMFNTEEMRASFLDILWKVFILLIP